MGETIADVLLRIYLLERACDAQVHAPEMGRAKVPEAPNGMAQRVAEQNADVAKIVPLHLVWPMLVRRIDPGYRK